MLRASMPTLALGLSWAVSRTTEKEVFDNSMERKNDLRLPGNAFYLFSIFTTIQ
jgi:hypothetical protein